MATTDKNEWHLLDSNFNKVSILPAAISHFKFILNEPGSGSLSIPMDSPSASLVASGMFVMASYRGSPRGGFSLDNIRKDYASEGNEDGGLWMDLSGSGELVLLEDGIVLGTGDATVSTRDFSGTKAGVLATLIDEAKARTGCLTNVTYDFTSVVDSLGNTWTDNEPLTLTVGINILQVLRKIAKFGIDFSMQLVGTEFVLSAYKNGIGSDISADTFFRVGKNCEIVRSDERGGDLKNALLLAYQSGALTVKDDTSINSYRRREKHIDASNAQSAASAATYGAALLSNQKDPKRSITVKVYDGVAPFVFLDYALGDTVSIDVDGVIETHRILGIQCDWDGTNYSDVTLELNSLLVEHELQMAQDLDWLLEEWQTAHDAGLLETRTWASVGMSGDDITSIRSILLDGDELYVVGQFTKIGGVFASNIAKYNISTGQWTALATGGALSIFMPSLIISSVCKIGNVIFAAGYEGDIWKLDGTWTLVGQADEFEPGINSDVLCLATDGTDLFVGGNFPSIEGVANTSLVSKLTVATGTWSALSAGITGNAVNVLLWMGSTLYAGGDFTGYVQKFSSGSWSVVGAGLDGIVHALIPNGTNLIAGGEFTGRISGYDGSVWAVLGGGVNGTVRGLALYLADIVAVGDFTDVGNRIARLSGEEWWALEEGINFPAYTVVFHDTTVYVAGLFTTAGTISVQKIAAYFTSFVELLAHLGRSSEFDLAAAIHGAIAKSSMSDADEFGMWDSISGLLRKITWANIKASLKTYFDTLYVALTGNQTIAGKKKFTNVLIVGDHAELYGASDGDIFQQAPDGENPSHIINTWGGIPGRVPFVAGGTELSPTAVASAQVIDQPSVPYTWNGADYASAGRLRAVATENHATGARGIKWELWACPIGSTTEALVATFDENGINIPTGTDFMVNGTPVGGGSAPATTAANDFQVGNGAGAWIKKTLAEVKTILGLGTAAYTASTDYAVAAKGVTNGDSHDHSGGGGAQIAYGGLSGLPRFLYPFGSYTTLSPLTTTNSYPFSSTLPSFTTYPKQYSQAVFIAAGTSDASNYWTLELTDYGTGTVIASVKTQSLAANAGYLLTDTTMALSSLTQATHRYLYLIAKKTGTPSNLFVHTPAVEYELS